MTEAWQKEPLADRVEAALSYEDRELIAEIRRMEQAAAGQVTSVVRNGQFPRWSFERWALIAQSTILLLVWVFGAGGNWSTVIARLEALNTSVVSLSVGLGNETESREQADRRHDDRLDAIILRMEPTGLTPRTMRFSRDSQTSLAKP